MKMYILVRDAVPLGHAMSAVAHASLACALQFDNHPDVKSWLAASFKKVVCRVSDADFERAKKVADHVLMTESALNGEETALAFRPRQEWPKAFKFFQLYR